MHEPQKTQRAQCNANDSMRWEQSLSKPAKLLILMCDFFFFAILSDLCGKEIASGLNADC